MVPYASQTNNARNLAALRAAGWRLMMSPAGKKRPHGFPYALDNGAWSAFTTGGEFNAAAFEASVASLGAGADFIVVPDIVAGGLASLAFSRRWLGWLYARPELARVPLALPVQDGCTPGDVADLIGPGLGVFVGGGTDWKLSTLPLWARFARERGTFCHVGRVNTTRRVALCAAAGVDSFDGSSPSRYRANLGKLDEARKQIDLEAYLAGLP